jgi:hypothetical protein
MSESESSERRRRKRVPFIQEVEVVGVGRHRCSDLSIDGMYLETIHSVPVGSICELKFKLHDSDPQPIQVQACVLYVHDGVGMGLGFVNLTPADLERIKKFMEKR